MQKLIETRRRIEVVRSIQSIARTMATVASAKLSRTRERAAGMRTYTGALRDIIRRQEAYAALRGTDLTAISPFLALREHPQRVLVLHLSGDRGMCGAYNLSINRVCVNLIRELQGRGLTVDVYAKGQRGAKHLPRRFTNIDIVVNEGWARSGPGEDVDRIYEQLSGWYLDNTYDEVWCTYTKFFTPLKRIPTAVRLLPLAAEDTEAAQDEARTLRWFYEPAFEPVLNELLGMFVRLQIEDVLLESYASEMGARMITMEEATERAGKMLQELQVQCNRLRRESITTDLLGVLFASKLRSSSS